MRRNVIRAGAAAAALGLVAFLLQPAPAGSAAPGGRVVRVGLIGTLFRNMPEPIMQAAMRPFKSLLEAQTGMTGELVAGGDVGHLAALLKEDKVQFGVFHGVEFAWARLNHPSLRPLIVAVNGRPAMHAVVVVPLDSKAATCADLKGKTVALPADSREHCRLFFDRRCVAPGCCPEKFFGRVVYPGDVEEALDDVVDCKVDALVVDGLTLEAYQKLKPGRAARLRTLRRSEPFPAAVVAYQPGSLSDDLLARFRDGLLGASSSRRGQRLLEMCKITSFKLVPDDYEEMLKAIAKAYPPTAAAK
ncbi:MAG TPA: PhnD/SsuA/transferrin family substrate-binding protein [Gemmataceae bacterium]|jgi:ABC-type phosphate/phosphonate transport system substrate-binding protein|nr:PhnD/SsuA/transferrin family substrate-binding protein [Gemmataceae bacterium]